MCGIAGFYKRQVPGAEAARLLEAMLQAIHHRGPDSSGAYGHPGLSFAFGMKRLSILDLAGGDQPIWNEDHTVGVVFNGEIYNYTDLRRKLESEGHGFATRSDTEVLVHLYEKEGAALVKQLRGMFAFCILDLNRNVLFCARDHFGQKPFYYHADDGVFAFSSELKSLFELPFVSAELNPQAFYDYVSWLSLPAPDTHFRSVSKLKPGESLVYDLKSGRIREKRRYWQMEFDREPLYTTEADAVEALDGALERSVREHLQADVPVGILLSSGLDSGAISAYVKRVSGTALTAFTVDFEDSNSEWEGATRTAQALGLAHEQIRVGAEDLYTDLRRVAHHLDEPVGDPAAFAVYRLCLQARTKVKVLLGGEGSDELLGGYGARYAGIAKTMERSERLRKWLGWIPAPHDPFPGSRSGRFRLRMAQGEAAELAGLRMEGLPGNVLAPLGLNREQLRQLRRRTVARGGECYTAQSSFLSAVQMWDLSWQLPESLLQKADKMSMAASIELRCPFLDLQVAEVASRLSAGQRLNFQSGEGKQVLRRCLAGRFPELAQVPKRGFALPLGRWLRGPLRRRFEEEIFRPQGQVCGYLDEKLLRAAWDAFLNGAPLAQLFYGLWLYETWQQNSGRCKKGIE